MLLLLLSCCGRRTIARSIPSHPASSIFCFVFCAPCVEYDTRYDARCTIDDAWWMMHRRLVAWRRFGFRSFVRSPSCPPSYSCSYSYSPLPNHTASSLPPFPSLPHSRNLRLALSNAAHSFSRAPQTRSVKRHRHRRRRRLGACLSPSFAFVSLCYRLALRCFRFDFDFVVVWFSFGFVVVWHLVFVSSRLHPSFLHSFIPSFQPPSLDVVLASPFTDGLSLVPPSHLRLSS